MKKIILGIIILSISTFLLITLGADKNKEILFEISLIFSTIILLPIGLFIYRKVKPNTISFINHVGKIFFYLVMVVTLGKFLSFVLVQGLIKDKNNKQDSTIEFYKNIEELVKNENSNCPKLIDSSTQLNKVYYLKSDTSFNLDIKILKYTKDEIIIDTFKNIVNKMNQDRISNDSSLNNLSTMKVKLIYNYFDSRDSFLFKLSY